MRTNFTTITGQGQGIIDNNSEEFIMGGDESVIGGKAGIMQSTVVRVDYEERGHGKGGASSNRNSIDIKQAQHQV